MGTTFRGLIERLYLADDYGGNPRSRAGLSGVSQVSIWDVLKCLGGRNSAGGAGS